MILVKSYKTRRVHVISDQKVKVRTADSFMSLTICGKRPKQTAHEGQYSEVTCNECRSILMGKKEGRSCDKT